MNFLYSFVIINMIYLSYGQISSTVSERDCGILDERLLNNGKQSVALEEYPWTALVRHRDEYTEKMKISCQGVLVSKRVVITTHICLISGQTQDVVLGDWDTTLSKDCDAYRQCAEDNAEIYQIDEIILNAAYNAENLTSDIGMLRLDRDVLYTKYISPICLPSAQSFTQNNLIARHLYVGGFRFHSDNHQSKTKSIVQILSPGYCKQNLHIVFPTTSALLISDEQICGNTYGNSYLSGLGLMDVVVENNRPKYFYLVGIYGYGSRAAGGPEVFHSIFKWLKWIQNNLD